MVWTNVSRHVAHYRSAGRKDASADTRGRKNDRQSRLVFAGPFNGPEDFNTWDRCITRGIPTAFIPTAYNNAYRILQTPDEVVIFFELLHTFRVIPIGARPHIDGRIRQWEGDSRGRWEGDTLVVDVTNFSDKTKGTLPPNGSSGETRPPANVHGNRSVDASGRTLHPGGCRHDTV